ncbi:MAG: DUF3048 domain-containing protein [Patescibacteria group bacterium]
MNLKNLLGSKKLTIIASFIGLYLISAGISLLVFSYLFVKNGSADSFSSKRSRINLDLPKTEECPINGGKFTRDEKNIWETRRPIAAIIENHLDSRPQSGLSKADVVYEAVAEGGITRFLGVFYCNVMAEEVKIAPVRSARIYFVNIAAGYGENPIFLHQGGANNFCPSCPDGVKVRGQVDKTVDAYTALDKLGWRNGQHGNDMDGGFNVGFPVVERNQYRLGSEPAAWEHSVVANIDEVYNEAKKRGFEFNDEDGNAWNENFRLWKFEDLPAQAGGKAGGSPMATDIKFGFWDGKPEYDVEWKYDSISNAYKRFNGESEHLDWEFDKPQISSNNVIVMFAKEKSLVDAEGHQFYEVVGTGDAIIFMNGEVVEGTWKKKTQLDREVFYDTNGDEIEFNRGPIWIEILPAGNEVSY